MNANLEFILRTVLIGAGATVLLDLWAIFLQRAFGLAPPDWRLVGRWAGHLVRGRFTHENIATAAPVRGEGALGWVVHYATGVIYAALLLAVTGLEWARDPTWIPALAVGVLTVIAPFFILQPGMGAGIAASKTPAPNVMRLRSLMTHTVFGLGLFAAAWAVAWALR